MATEYLDAIEVYKIARKLIEKHHQHLHGSRIEYVFVTPTPKSKQKEIWGRTRKISGLNAWLSTPENERESIPEPYFVIEISKEIWDFITNEQRIALTDHELSHCGFDDETETITTLAHDVEEFSGVISRNGLWRYDLEEFIKTAKEKDQMPLLEKEIESAVAAGREIVKEMIKK
jgi:predicted metallopeptidase